jgi:hypothetical protein
MKRFSIIRVGNEYVVGANDKSILKMASRRTAERTVADAAELLDSQASPPLSPDGATGPSMMRECKAVPDRGTMRHPSKVP